MTKNYDKNIIENYNKNVLEKIKNICDENDERFEDYQPLDIHGKKHLLGYFDFEKKENQLHSYEKFITQGAKKYAFENNGEIKITVSGVPKKSGAKALKKLEDFKDDFVFKNKDTGKMCLSYIENQENIELIDFTGKKAVITDVTGVCLFPVDYTLKKSHEYVTLLDELSTERSRFRE